MTAFPDLTKDQADVVLYSMDWTSRLGSDEVAAVQISVWGTVTAIDKTAAYPARLLSIQVSGGSGPQLPTGDPLAGTLSVVTVVATLVSGQVLSRSFNVVLRKL